MSSDKKSLEVLIGAELPLDHDFWTVDRFENGSAVLKAHGKERSLPLQEFMKTAGLSEDQFDLSMPEEKKEEPVPEPEEEIPALKDVPAFHVYLTDTVYTPKSSLLFPRYPRITIRADFDRSKLDRFVVFDTEATGLVSDHDQIVQLSAIRYVHGKPAMTYNTYIKPDVQMSREASNITGLTNEMLKDAPTFSQIADSFREFVGEDPLVGYYIKFDLRMLWMGGLDLVSNHTCYDAQWYVFAVIPKGFLKDRKLGTVAAHLGITFPAHNSLADSYATGEVFLNAVNKIIQINE
jgi:DNA polymerase III epsilon subunit family exonuclease